MSALVKCDDSKVRATHRAWGNVVDRKPMFDHVVTLDVELAEESWDRLSVYTPNLEFREMPVRLHRALVMALSNLKTK